MSGGEELIVVNARVVTRTSVLEDASVSVREGRIAAVGGGVGAAQVIDAQGCWLLPGLIDVHNDAIEGELEPRPNACIPLALALPALEGRLLAHGITTVFHSLAMMGGRPGTSRAQRIVETIRGIALASAGGGMRHRVHARYEIPEPGYAAPLLELIRAGLVHMVSYMDHTPGQGQYRDVSRFVAYLCETLGLNAADARKQVHARQARARASGGEAPLAAVLAEAARHRLPIASHDDDCEEAVVLARARGATICEFPIALEVARKASSLGMHVIVGAPNVFLGKSNTGNMRAVDAIRDGAADMMCSDYHAPTMLPAVFALRASLGLPGAVALVTAGPAAAVGLDAELGSIETGKRADFILVREDEGSCVVESAFVEGRAVLTRSLRGPKEEACCTSVSRFPPLSREGENTRSYPSSRR